MTAWVPSSSVLILTVIALRYLLWGKISLRMQYAPWLLVLVRLLVPVNFGASSLSVMNAVPARTQTVQANTVPLSGSAKYVLDSEGVPPGFWWTAPMKWRRRTSTETARPTCAGITMAAQRPTRISGMAEGSIWPIVVPLWLRASLRTRCRPSLREMPWRILVPHSFFQCPLYGVQRCRMRHLPQSGRNF